MNFIIEHVRIKELEDRTIGRITLPDIGTIYTLEDTVRPYGVKIMGQTAIPYNNVGYKCTINHSARFKRDVIMLYTEDDNITLKTSGISFKYIYLHGGNTPLDTSGCILVAKIFNPISNTIHQSCEGELFNYIKHIMDNGGDVIWKIVKHLEK